MEAIKVAKKITELNDAMNTTVRRIDVLNDYKIKNRKVALFVEIEYNRPRASYEDPWEEIYLEIPSNELINICREYLRKKKEQQKMALYKFIADNK